MFALVTLAAGSAVCAAAQENGLVARWSFDEGTGAIVRDSSGKGCDLNLKGATWATAKVPPAIDFNGTSAYLEARDPQKGRHLRGIHDFLSG